MEVRLSGSNAHDGVVYTPHHTEHQLRQDVVTVWPSAKSVSCCLQCFPGVLDFIPMVFNDGNTEERNVQKLYCDMAQLEAKT